jgi:hypothetical protein
VWRPLFLSISLIVTLVQGAKDVPANEEAAASSAAPAISSQRGDALFHGQEPLTAKIRGHEDEDTLPAEAIRCANCHAATPASAGAQPLSRIAPPHLDRALLLEFHERRGGPPSRYDQAAFCKVLRTGVDPAHILIAREMPAYVIDDAQCASLWTYALAQDAKDSSTENPTAKPKETPTEEPSAKR